MFWDQEGFNLKLLNEKYKEIISDLNFHNWKAKDVKKNIDPIEFSLGFDDTENMNDYNEIENLLMFIPPDDDSHLNMHKKEHIA